MNKWIEGALHYVHDTYICVDATYGCGEHGIEIRFRENNKGDQITHGCDPGKEACLDGATNKSINSRVRPVEATSPAREDDD